LTRLAKEHRIPYRDVIAHTGAFRKRSGRWRPTKRDRIHRPPILFYEKGQQSWILTDDSRFSSFIGDYLNAVKLLLEGQKDALKPFRNEYVLDIKGKKHYFETNTRKIIEIHERREEAEFPEVYKI
jgi:hypothetical protein